MFSSKETLGRPSGTLETLGRPSGLAETLRLCKDPAGTLRLCRDPQDPRVLKEYLSQLDREHPWEELDIGDLLRQEKQKENE